MKFFSFVLIVLSFSLLNAQPLVLPVKNKISLAGNYAELRKNHFHMGLDFKTDNLENLPVHAAESGYVSRILISPGGYGKCLYVDHPRIGITTVYAHLNEFEYNIQKWTDETQYALKKNTLDTVLPPNVLPVTRDQMIALSGNTGRSSAPHLHFETRNTTTEKTINPLYFYSQISDKKAPVIGAIALYEIDEGRSNYQKTTTPNGINVIHSQKIGLGVSTHDLITGSTNTMGIYEISLYDKNQLQYRIRFDSLSFDWQSHIRAVSDYSIGQPDMYKLFYEECGFNITNPKAENGTLYFSENEIKDLRIEVADYSGNRISKTVQLQYRAKPKSPAKEGIKLRCSSDHTIESNNFEVYFPKNCLTSNKEMKYKKLAAGTNETLKLQILNEYIPVINGYTLKYHLPADDHNSKLYLQTILDKKPKTYIGVHKNNYLEFSKIKTLGILSIRYDLQKPSISKPKKSGSQIIFIINDTESGISDYHLYIQGHWKKVYYDEKTNRLIYRNKDLSNGRPLSYQLVVTDKVGNKNIESGEIFF